MIITLKSGDVITINEKFEPKVAVGGQSDMTDWAKRIKAYCAASECRECIFDGGAGKSCKLEGGLPDSWGV